MPVITRSQKRAREEENQNQAEKFPRIETPEDNTANSAVTQAEDSTPIFMNVDDEENPIVTQDPDLTPMFRPNLETALEDNTANSAVTTATNNLLRNFDEVFADHTATQTVPNLTPNRILVALESGIPATTSYVAQSHSSNHHFGGSSSSNSDNPPAAAHHAPNANHHQHLGELPPRFNPPVQPNNMGLGMPTLLSTVAAGVLALIAKQWSTGNQEGFDEIDNSDITPKRLNQLAILANKLQNAEQLDRIARHQNCQMPCARFILNSKHASAETKEYINNSGKNQFPIKKEKVRV